MFIDFAAWPIGQQLSITRSVPKSILWHINYGN